jgi:hypothetical protein
MAFISQLVDLLADCFELERGTVRHVARNLREEGLLPTGRGGQNAANIDAMHAATLLLGVMANRPTAAVEFDALYRHASLLLDRVHTADGRMAGLLAPPSDGSAFGDMIVSCPQAALAALIQTRGCGVSVLSLLVHQVERMPMAIINLLRRDSTGEITGTALTYVAPETAEATLWAATTRRRAYFYAYAEGSLLADIADLLQVPPEGSPELAEVVREMRAGAASPACGTPPRMIARLREFAPESYASASDDELLHTLDGGRDHLSAAQQAALRKRDLWSMFAVAKGGA